MIDYDLKKIRAMAFDVDGVLASELVYLCDGRQPMRTANTKDGYALQLAVKSGFRLAIITGSRQAAVRDRYRAVGVQDIFMAIRVKVDCLNVWMRHYGLAPEEVLYMGDDIPDYEALEACGLPCCPADAVPEIRSIARYVSPCIGGGGCVRDVVEQVLRAQGKWMEGEAAFAW